MAASTQRSFWRIAAGILLLLVAAAAGAWLGRLTAQETPSATAAAAASGTPAISSGTTANPGTPSAAPPEGAASPSQPIAEAGPPALLSCDARLFQGRPALLLTFEQPLARDQDFGAALQAFDLGPLADSDATNDGNEADGSGAVDEAAADAADATAAPGSRDASPGKVLPAAWSLDDNPHLLWYTAARPSRQYRVQAGPPLLAGNGTAMRQAADCRVDSPAMPPTFYFASRGVVLPAGQNGGLPVVTVNVPVVDVEFLRIRPERVADFYDKVLGYGLGSGNDDDRWRYRSNRALQGNVGTWELDQLAPLGESVFRGRFDTTPDRDLRQTSFLPVEAIEALRAPGIYIAIMSEPGRYRYEFQVTHFYVSDIGLHLRQHERQHTAFVTSLRDASAMPGVEVSLLDARGQTLASAISDAEGKVSFDGDWRAARVLRARRGDEQSLLALYQPALDLSEFPVTGLPGGDPRAFIWAGRTLYRPGETFVVSALVRNADGEALPPQAVQADWKQPDGRVVRTEHWRPSASEAGYLQGGFDLPADAPTGRWRLELRAEPGDATPLGVWNFQVEDFLPERLELTFDEHPPALAAGEDWRLTLQGDYRHGAPAAGHRVVSEMRGEPADQLLPAAWPGYRFGDLARTSEDNWQSLPELELDAEGRAEWRVPSSLMAATAPTRWIASLRLLDSGGRPVIRQAEATLWPAPVLIGIRPGFAGDTTADGGNATFDVIRVDPQGQLSGLSQAEVRLLREHREYHWRYDEQSGWSSAFIDQDELVEALSLDLASGQNTLQFPVQWGRYRLEILDSDTGEMLTYRFFAGWDAEAAGELGQRPDRVQLKVGPQPVTAATRALQVEVQPPHDGIAVLTLETDRVLWSARVPVLATGSVVEVPWPEGLARHDAYVTATVFRPAGEGDTRQATPSRAVGIAYVALDRRDRRLELALSHPPQVRPGTTLDLEIQLAEAPAPGSDPLYVTVSAVDTGILDLVGDTLPSPWQAWFGQQRYDGRLLDLYGRLIERMPGTTARLRWGGDSAGAMRGDLTIPVKLVDIFHGPVGFDAEGRATVALELPDFDGRLRLQAVAFGERRYGSGQSDVTLVSPWVADWATPLFLRTGDRSQAWLELQNRSGGNGILDWRLKADGALQPPRPAAGSVTLADSERQRLAIMLEAAAEPGPAALSLQRQPRDPAVALPERTRELPVLPTAAASSATGFISVPAGAHLTVPLSALAQTLPAGRQLGVRGAAQPALDWAPWASALLTYAYPCAEQTVSAHYPLLWLSAGQLAALPPAPGLAAAPLPSPEAIPGRLAQAVARLVRLQTPGGAFTLWPGGDADPWLTAWVAQFLNDMAQASQPLPPDLLSAALDATRGQLQGAPAALQELPVAKAGDNPDAPYAKADRMWADEAHARFAAAALAGYVLAQRQQAPLGTLRQLWDQHRARALSPLPLLQLGLALQAMGDQPRAEAAFQRAASQVYQATPWTAGTTDYGSRLRDLAWSLALAYRHNVLADHRDTWLAEVLEILNQRQGRGLSTQEWQALVQAGLALPAAAQGQDWRLQVRLGSDAARQLTPATDATHWRAEPALQAASPALTLHNPGSHPVFVRTDWQGYPRDAAQGADTATGLKVERRWFHPDGTPWNGEPLVSGDALIVRLDAQAERPVRQALLVDPLPAGFALDNLALLDDDALPDADYDGVTLRDSLRDGRVHERSYRDDRFVAALDVDGTVSLLYRVQVLNPGSYHVPAAVVSAMYQPEFRAASAAAPPAATAATDPRDTRLVIVAEQRP
ncbi:MAG: alpha-2-macroglobulin family protein [Pigmentiphaga sp.]|nr:alpha-2-macroglobulin family protein [Pigmentiphaga sp.]